MLNIILFGSTGMLGRYVHKVLLNCKHFNIICITRSDFDIVNDSWTNLNSIIAKNCNKNDVIINCAGIIPQKTSLTDYKTYIRVNTLFPHKLQEYSNYYNLKFIHITTDCVFDGSSSNYLESSLHTETNIYGISKSLGELENSCVIRTSIIGEELEHKKSLLEWIISNKNKTINGFENHYWNGVSCLTLANIIKQIIEKSIYWKGIKHIYSPDIFSKYKLCVLINNIYNLNININPIKTDKDCNKTLSSIYESIFIIENIEKQIIEQKAFNLTNIIV